MILPEKTNLFINRIFILVTALFLLLFYSCSDNPSSIGADLLKNDNLNINEIDSFKDSLAQKSSDFKRTMELGGAYTLLVGKNNNVEASTLLNFYFGIPDSLKNSIEADSIIVTGAKVSLIRDYPNKANDSFYDFTVHKVESGWTGVHFTSDSLPLLSYDPADISSNKSITDSLDEFDISNDAAYSWLKYAADSIGTSYGIYIKPTENSEKVVGYFSLYNGGTSLPSITIAIHKAGLYDDTLTFYASSNISAVTGNIHPGNVQSSIIVQGGLTINAKLWFDVSQVPFNAVINDAKLTLNLDNEATYIGDTTNTIFAGFLTDSSSNVLDSTVFKAFSRGSNSVTGTITSYVQRWVNSKVNEGMLLFPSNLSGSVDLFSFLGSNAADLLKPRLHIIYTVKK